MQEQNRIIRDLTSGSVPKTLISFSLPLFLSGLLQMVYNMVDMIVVGQFVGTEGLSAVSIGGEVLLLITFVAMGFSNAGQILISRYVGEKRKDRIGEMVATLFTLLLSMMMIPFEMLIITNYRTVIDLGIYDTVWALVLPFTSSIFYTYILKNFFDTVPESLYWSARIDGSSNWHYLWKVMVPMARSSLTTVILLNALASWNSFMWPMYVIITDKNRTLPWGLQVFTTEAGSNPEQQMAASTVVVLPMIILFLFARKYIVGGVARGGLKG